MVKYKICFVLAALLPSMCVVDVAACEAVSDYEALRDAADCNSIPLVNICTDIESVNKEEYVPGIIEIFDLQARTEGGQPAVKYNCKLKYRGATSLAYEKKSFAIKMYDDNGEKTDVNVFGIREDDNWILDAMAIDRARMRNRVCFDLWNLVSRTPYDTDYDNRNGTAGVFVEVFINGNYHGLYCMTDKINLKLLGLKKAKEEDDGSVVTRGLLYKGSSWTDATTLYGYDETAPTDTEEWEGWELQYPDDYPSAEAWRPLMDFIDLFQEPSDVFALNYAEYLDKDNLSDYIIMSMACNYGDNVMKNTFLSTVNITEGHKYLVTPWDMDMSLGGNWNGGYLDEMAKLTRLTKLKLFYYLYNENIDGFKDDLARKWDELSQTVFSMENVYQCIDGYADMFTLSGAWNREYLKWNGNPVALKENIADETGYVKDWYARNYENMSTMFGTEAGVTALNSNKVVIDADGSVLTISYAGGLSCAVYTVDGIVVGSRYNMSEAESFRLDSGNMYIVRLSDGSSYKIVM